MWMLLAVVESVSACHDTGLISLTERVQTTSVMFHFILIKDARPCGLLSGVRPAARIIMILNTLKV